jgi:hypothetical protein
MHILLAAIGDISHCVFYSRRPKPTTRSIIEPYEDQQDSIEPEEGENGQNETEMFPYLMLIQQLQLTFQGQDKLVNNFLTREKE